MRILIGAFGAFASVAIGSAVLRYIAASRVPDAEMTTIRGEQLRLTDFRGGPVLIVFWASDCAPCIAEIPELVRLDRELSGHGLHLIAVAMAYDLPSRVLALTAAAGVDYRVVLDLRGTIAESFDRIDAVPTAILIGPDGNILERRTGPIDFKALRVRLLRMLGDS
jgi:thiol-disulfide isomerase/thioredoxin